MLAQFILFGILTLSLGVNMSKYFKKGSLKDVWRPVIIYIVFLALLYWGGFFDKV
jgi:H+/Cl- antiporter ClcA